MPSKPAKKRPRRRVTPKAPSKREGQKAQKDKRVRLIADMLITAQYIPHVTPAELADQWGITPHEVEVMASETARYLRLRLSDDDILGATLLGGLQTIFANAVGKNEAGDAVKAALAIIGIRPKLWTDGSGGANAPPETFELELALVDEARRAAETNEAPAIHAPPPPAEGPAP